jgi:hypothetical protein
LKAEIANLNSPVLKSAWQVVNDENHRLKEGLRRIPYEDSMTKRIDMAAELLK